MHSRKDVLVFPPATAAASLPPPAAAAAGGAASGRSTPPSLPPPTYEQAIAQQPRSPPSLPTASSQASTFCAAAAAQACKPVTTASEESARRARLQPNVTRHTGPTDGDMRERSSYPTSRCKASTYTVQCRYEVGGGWTTSSSIAAPLSSGRARASLALQHRNSIVHCMR
jgi:hypothetical protein